MHRTIKGMFLELDGDQSIWAMTEPGTAFSGDRIVSAYQWDPPYRDQDLPAREWHSS
jgi:hypothetical protein